MLGWSMLGASSKPELGVMADVVGRDGVYLSTEKRQ